MTLDEAIKHEEEVAEQNEWFDKNCLESMQCRECAAEHRQLAEWLKDYKRLLEQEQKIGHWEWVQYDYNPKLGNWNCSECHCVVLECADKEAEGGIPLYKYCPQCGAKMKGDDKPLN